MSVLELVPPKKEHFAAPSLLRGLMSIFSLLDIRHRDVAFFHSLASFAHKPNIEVC